MHEVKLKALPDRSEFQSALASCFLFEPNET